MNTPLVPEEILSTIRRAYKRARRKWHRPGPEVKDEHLFFLEALSRVYREKLPDRTAMDEADRKKFFNWKCTAAGKQMTWELNWADLREASRIARAIEREGALSSREILWRKRILKIRLAGLESLILSSNARISKTDKGYRYST